MLLVSAAFAWSQHAWMVDAAVDGLPAADAPVVVEPLEAWLASDSAGIAAVVLSVEAGEKVRREALPMAAPGVQDFLAAARLNPDTTFALVRRRLPGEPATEDVDPTSISRYLTPRAPWDIQFDRLAPGQVVMAREVLRSHVDEPDWGFDDALWSVPEYGFGRQPYGLPEGESSKAPFHMRFAHENVLVRMAAPEVASDLPQARAALFVALAQRAHATGHEYWAWRLTAWAAHYVMDVSMPYHSRAHPAAGLGWYVDFALAADKESRKVSAAREVGSRHLLYEEGVAYMLQSALTEGDTAGLLGALRGEAATAPPLRRIFIDLGRHAAAHARRVDRVVTTAFARFPVDLSEAEDVPPVDVVAAIGSVADPEPLWVEARRDLALAGVGTRALIAQIW